MEGVEETLIRFQRGKEVNVISVTEESRQLMEQNGWVVEEEIMKHTRLAIPDDRAE